MKGFRNINPDESQIQSAYVEWCRANQHRHLGLKKACWITNGAQAASMKCKSKRERAITVNLLRKQGLVDGMPDFLVPIITIDHAGLFIEFKSVKGVLSEAQKETQRELVLLGYDVHNAFCIDSAIEKTEQTLAKAKKIVLTPGYVRSALVLKRQEWS